MRDFHASSKREKFVLIFEEQLYRIQESRTTGKLRSLESQAFSAAFDAVSQKCRFEYVRGDDGLADDARI
jgi:hypothetical protein